MTNPWRSRLFLAVAWTLTLVATASKAQTPTASSAVGLGGGGAVFAPVVAPYDPKLMFVACDMTGVYRSKDGGDNWTMLKNSEVQITYLHDWVWMVGNENGYFARYAFSVAIDPSKTPAANGQIHIVGAKPDPMDSSKKLLVESTNGGDTWTGYPAQLPAGYEGVTTATFSATGQLFVGTTSGVLIGQTDASGNPSPFLKAPPPAGTTDFVKKIVAVKAPSTGAQTVFIATEREIYRLDGTTWTAIGGSLSKPATGIAIQDLVGASTTGRYVLYATVTRSVVNNAWTNPVWRYEKTSTNTPSWVSDSAGLNLDVKEDRGCHDGWGAFEARYQYLATSDANPDIAYVSVVNNQCYPFVYKRTANGVWDWALSPSQRSTDKNNLTPGWIEIGEPPDFRGFGMGGASRGLAMSAQRRYRQWRGKRGAEQVDPA
jgi:hypothetical protein